MNAVRSLLVGLLVVGGLSWTAAYAQPPSPAPGAPAALLTPPPPADGNAIYLRSLSGSGGWSGSWAGHWGQQQQARELAQKLAETRSEDEKRDLRKKLTDVLGQQFDARMKQQQKELEDLEKQIAKLRDTLKRRQDNKEKIVDRHIDQMVEDAQGLGWSGPGTPHPFFGDEAAHFFSQPAVPAMPTMPKPPTAPRD
jgi:hypothetical protein